MSDRRNTRSFLEDYVDILTSSIAFFTASIRKNIVSFLLIILVFSAAGVAYWYSKTPYYESELVCGYVNQPAGRKIFGEMTQKLNLLALNGSRYELARQLGLSPAQTGSIMAIEGRNRTGSPLYEDITDDYQSMYFTLRATDNKVFGPFQTAFVNYFCNEPYQRQMTPIQREKVAQKVSYLRVDVRKVDSIVDAYTVALRNGLAFKDSTGNDFDIRKILDYKDALDEKLTNLERQWALDNRTTVFVIHGFAPGDKPSRGSKKVILAFAIVGVLAAMCWAILRGHRQQAAA